MKSHLIIPLAMLGIFTTAISVKAQTAITVKKAPAGVSVDGVIDDWKDTPPVFDAKYKLSYMVSNDDENLYLVIFAIDKLVKRKIMDAGLTVSVNTEGKKKKTYALTYPFIGTTTEATIKAAGFKGAEGDAISPETNAFGYKAAYKLAEDRTMGYEMAIPLKLLALKPDKSNEIYVNVCINGIDPAKMQQRRVNTSSSSGSKHSGGGGGRSTSTAIVSGSELAGMSTGGGGARFGASSDDEDPTESQDFWLKFTLAK